MLYRMFNKGEVGVRINVFSELGMEELDKIIENTSNGPKLKWKPIFDMNHSYQVAETIEDDDSIVIRMNDIGLDQSDQP